MKHSIRVPCVDCDGSGEKIDDRGLPVVCDGCLGMTYHDQNPDGPACDIDTHEEVGA